jgi:hypothetical protein
MAEGDIVLPKNSAELRDAFLRDIRLAAIDTGIVEEPPTQPGTDWFLLGEASSRLALQAMAGVLVSDRDRSIITATGSSLEQQRQAAGLPELPAAGSSGKLIPDILGSTTIVNGSGLVLPNGLRAQVVGTYVNPQPLDEIDIEAIDVGAATNLAAGEVVRFVSPPINVGVEAKVSSGSPLTGGTDAETPEALRQRLLNASRNKPAGGNWADIRGIVLDNLGSVQDCYVYPALGGPSTCKVVPVKDFDVANNDYSRSVTSSTLESVRSLLFARLSIGNQNVVQAAADELRDVTILVELPESSLSGGNGQGWTDQVPWPQLEVADANDVMITSVASDSNITVDAETSTAPIPGQTTIAWWSIPDRKFYTALVTAVSGSAGAWVLTLDRPLRGKGGAGPQASDYICPAAQNLGKYGSSWIDLFRAFGPGQNTSDNDLLPRSLRRPFVSTEDRSSLTSTALTSMVQRHPEITDIAFGHISGSTVPTVPATVDDAPNVLVPYRFAVYPI